MFFLSSITVAILASVVFYTINKTQTYFEQQRIEKFKFNNELLIELLSNKQASLTQVSELAQNLIHKEYFSSNELDKSQHINKVWQTLNEQMDILFFEIWESPDKSFMKFSDLSEETDQSSLRKTLAEYVKQAISQGKIQSFLHCLDDCLFFNIEPVPFKQETYTIITGKSLANEFFLFSKAINENAGIIRQIENTDSLYKFSKERTIKSWNTAIMAMTQYDESTQLLKSIAQKYPDISTVEKKLIDMSGKYLSIAILEPGLSPLDSLQSQPQKISFIILNDESENYLALLKTIKDIVFAGIIIWLLSELVLFFSLNAWIKRLSNISTSLKLLTQEKFEQAKNMIDISRARRFIDEFDELEISDIQLTDRLQSLNHTNQLYKTSLENQLDQINRTMAFSQRVINESNSYILTQDKDMNITMINTKLEQLLGGFNNQLTFQNLCSDDTYPQSFKEQMLKLLNQQVNFYKHDAKFYNPDNDEFMYFAWSHVHVEDENGNILILSEGIDLTERIKAENRLSWMAYHDTLTGLGNRRAFQEAIQTISQNNHNALILLININRFKSINDLYGQHIGDAVLCETAKHLKTLVQKNDAVFRLAADEFGVIIYRVESKESANLLQKFSKNLQIDFDLNTIIKSHESSHDTQTMHNFIHYDCSIGGLYSENTDQTEDIIGNLSNALFHAKKAEGTLWHLYDESDNDIHLVKRENYIAQKIHYAIDHDIIQLLFQPIWSIDNDRISHYEVLTRMFFDDGEKIYPDEFIQVAERQSIIHQLDNYIMGKAFEILADKLKTEPDMRFSINVSAPTLQQSNYDEIVTNQLRLHNIPAKNVTLEVTETSVISNFNLALENLNKLVNKGLTIALDDFGVGFTSINYLKEMPLAYIKIDGLYIKNLVENYEDEVFVKSITAMAKAYGLKVIAEYVENEAILNKLKELNVSNAQGYYIGKPESYFLAADFKPTSTSNLNGI